MSKPEFSRPFSLEHAKAGHPVQTVAGDRAEVFKYDHAEFANFPLVGVIKHTRLCYWTEAGAGAIGVGDSYQDNLVMAPIGTIDGKPVYPGDMITWGGDTFPAPVEPPMPIDWASAKWPRDYPKTQMDDMVLTVEYNAAYLKKLRGADAIRAVANAVLRHAIDAGQVVMPGAAPSDDMLMKVAKAVMIEMRGLGGMAVYGFNENNCKSIIASVTGAKDAKEGAQ